MFADPVLRALAAFSVVVFIAIVGATLWRRGRVERRQRRQGTIWRRAHHLGTELASGRRVERNSDALVELIASTSHPMLVASAVAVAVRQEAGETHRALFAAVNRSRLADRLGRPLRCGDPRGQIEVLEIVEVLRVGALLPDAALLTRADDPAVIRAACDAVVAIDPTTGLGILIGLADAETTWVLDSMGRAASACAAIGRDTLPLARGRWNSAPLLAQRAVRESALFDPATVADAMAALVAALDHPAANRRLAAVNALAGTIDDHPAAQLALAGALGSPDRMVRFATAAALSESATGQDILRATAELGDGSDAARMAAQLLWSQDARRREIVVPVA